MNKAWVDPRVAVFVKVPRQHLAQGGGRDCFHQPPDYRRASSPRRSATRTCSPKRRDHYYRRRRSTSFTEALGARRAGLLQEPLRPGASHAGAASGAKRTSTGGPEYTSNGKGRSYGVELLLRHKLTKNFFGWIAYSSRGPSSATPARQDTAVPVQSAAQPGRGGELQAAVRLHRRRARAVQPRRALHARRGRDLRRQRRTTTTPSRARVEPPAALTFFQLDVRVDKRFVFESWMLQRLPRRAERHQPTERRRRLIQLRLH